MTRPLHRALTALTAALLTVVGAASQSPAAANPAQTVYVDPANGGLDGGDCAGSARACATIGYALTQVAAGGTVVVEAATYAEAVVIAQPVTLVGHDATIDSLDIGDANGTVDVSGFTITGFTSPLVDIHDTVASDMVAVHKNTITGATAPQTGVRVAGNAAVVSITGNTISETSDGITLTGNDQAAAYTVAGNAFAISTGSGAAIGLAAPMNTDSLAVTLGGNTGTISQTGQTITESGDGPITITSNGTPNSLAATSSSVTSADAPSKFSTLEDPTPFAMSLTSGSALPHARLDVTVVATNGIPTNQIQLGYNTDGGTTYQPITLAAANGSYQATVTGLDNFAAATSMPIYFQLAADDSSPAGNLTISLSLDEVANGSVINTVASTSFGVALNVNSAPAATPQPSVGVARNGSVDITLAASDADNDPINAWADASPSHGVLTGTAPNLTYTPTASYSGPDSFTFTASDGKGGTSAPATVSITVSADNTPVASDFTFGTRVVHGSPGVTIDLTSHASDADHDALTYNVSPTSQHGGTVSVNLQGIATYAPASSYGGTDTFTYWANDGTTESSPHGTVTLTVDIPPVVPTPPPATVAHNNNAVTTNYASIDMTAFDADGDTQVYSLISGPAHGSVARTGSMFKYYPGSNYVGTDSFTVRADDGHGGVSTGTASITVTDQTPTISGPGSPVRVNFNGAPTPIDVNVADLDVGDNATLKRVAPAAGKGSVTVSADGSTVTYTATPGATGADSFGLATTDGNQQSASVTVDIVIDTPPVAVDPSTKHVALGGHVTFLLKANDANGDTPTFSIDQPPHGTATLGSGSVTYAAPTNWAGTTSFPFTADDGHGGTDTGTVHVIVDKASTTISTVTVTPKGPTSAQRPTVTVSVASVGDTANGKVTVHLGTATYPATVTNGRAAVQLPALAGGNHTIMATFDGTATTVAVTKAVSKTFSVSRVASSISYKTDPLQLTTTTTNAVAIVHISTSTLRVNSGKVTITEVGVGLLASGSVGGGVVRLHLPQFSIGQHNLTVSYSGTPYIAPSSATEVERVSLGH